MMIDWEGLIQGIKEQDGGELGTLQSAVLLLLFSSSFVMFYNAAESKMLTTLKTLLIALKYLSPHRKTFSVHFFVRYSHYMPLDVVFHVAQDLPINTRTPVTIGTYELIRREPKAVFYHFFHP